MWGGPARLVPDRDFARPRRGRSALRARSDPARPHGVHRPHRDRRDDPRDRGAVDRARHRRLRAVPVAVLGVPAGPGRVGVGVREARGHVRPQAADAVRDRAVPAWAACCAGWRGACPRSSRSARCRASARAPSQPMAITDRGRHLHGGRARHRPGLHRERLGAVLGGRPDARRRVRRSSACGGGSSSSTCRCACSRACSSRGTSARPWSAASTTSTTSAPSC